MIKCILCFLLSLLDDIFYHYYYYYSLLSLFIFIIIIISLLGSFSHQCQLIVFHWSVSDGLSPRLSRTLLSILANINNVAVLMILILPLISNSASSLLSPWGLFQLHQLLLVSLSPYSTAFFRTLVGSKYLSIFSISFIFTLWSMGIATSTN